MIGKQNEGTPCLQLFIAGLHLMAVALLYVQRWMRWLERETLRRNKP